MISRGKRVSGHAARQTNGALPRKQKQTSYLLVAITVVVGKDKSLAGGSIQWADHFAAVHGGQGFQHFGVDVFRNKAH